MLNFLQKIGHKTLGRFAALGRSANMLFGALVHIPNFKKGT
ncbi:MAG: ABC transporter permease, partial [Pseudoalteromonas nigrifaciens]